jgi:LytR cell envelope-related transcriptional attenuator
MSGVQAPRPGRRAKRGPEAGQATPSVVAVASLVAVVVAMVAFFASGDQTATQAQDASSTQSTTPSPPPEGPATAARTPRAEKPDSAKQAKPASHQVKRDQRKDKPRKQKRANPPAQVPQVYVEVYNNTSIDGLAASRAAQLQDAGWQVVGVDNWYGDIPASTVYHPDGFSAEAKQLAEELGISRVRGSVAPMRFDRLTVILTEDAY